MQEAVRDDYVLQHGGLRNGYEKEMCPTIQGNNSVNFFNKPHTVVDSLNNFEAALSCDIKLEDNNSVDLFPVHTATWQQSHESRMKYLQQRHSLKTENVHKKLLLQSSDDPLISSVADEITYDDDHPAEFRTLIAVTHKQKQQQQLQLEQKQQLQVPPITIQRKILPKPIQEKQRPQNGCSLLTKQQLKVKAGLMSAQQQKQTNTQATTTIGSTSTLSNSRNTRTAKPKKKGAVKLRFHHQALPPEYLSHYEATERQFAKKATKQTKDAQPKETRVVKLTQGTKLPPQKSAHENVRSWLQKIAELQRSATQQQQQHQKQQQQQTQMEADKQRVQPIPQLTIDIHHDDNNNNKFANTHEQTAIKPMFSASVNTTNYNSFSPTRTYHANTENNTSKPSNPNSPNSTAKRVQNYKDLPYMGEITLDNSKPRRGRKPKKADICHLIYKNYGTIVPGTPKAVIKTETMRETMKTTLPVTSAEEPLNLCMRDQCTDMYSISSEDEDEACASDTNSNSATPITTSTDNLTDTLLAANMKILLPEFGESKPVFKQEPVDADNTNHTNGNIIDTNNLLHPMSYYYQKLLESGNGQAFGLPIETIEKDNQLSLKIPIPSNMFLTPKLEKQAPVLSNNCNTTIDYPEQMSTPSSVKSENSVATNTTTASSATPLSQMAPQKRKRSAIFIPPMPAENATNPPTEVSICKFKFTGGPKPTLQEKKMLSVDSDGNYRYYNGTGDKSMRGYEFFPRESLQQSGVLPGVNCAGAFLNATGEKICLDVPPPSTGLSNELLQIPDSPTSTPTSTILLPNATATAARTTPTSHMISNNTQQTCFNAATENVNLNQKTGTNIGVRRDVQPHMVNDESTTLSGVMQRNHSERRRKSRRSTQREKLEKTFKEKGFLIQTQQLESAEGATYCKFRQLKKFTRYLFRNWKDYLPEGVQGQVDPAAITATLSRNQSHVGADKIQNVNVNCNPEDISALETMLESQGYTKNLNALELN
ncbi:uncharacterized protein LOC119667568 [Teleopsis dalmanni]|uniref:uncharacterized protein LOC119667568 n=1 Tax=Teleopsis dalmanni TaxID=139649 RepID=UPI0018CF461B|nr:uncharacterized protein LOC119667568 [Teleopsis dalmanni]